jgi:hypothetical protein
MIAWLRSLFRPRDREMDALEAQIAVARAKHQPVRHLLAARQRLLHERLRAYVAAREAA